MRTGSNDLIVLRVGPGLDGIDDALDAITGEPELTPTRTSTPELPEAPVSTDVDTEFDAAAGNATGPGSA
jgi:hypothetical protein